jgi:D-3-phosphoglycerate dehydrogenase
MPYRILVTDNVDPRGLEILQAVPDFDVEVSPTLPPDELVERIGGFDAIIGRSATRISPELLQAATRLKVVGRAGVGVDNVAMDDATRLGIAVINAPAGNTIAVVELFFGGVISLLRHLPRADQTMHEGRWERSHLVGTELKGKTLGIVGLGRIGGEIAQRAHAFGMKLTAYDPYISAERFRGLRTTAVESLEELMTGADIVTVHTPLNDETRSMIGPVELAHLGDGAIVVNMARGGIVVDEALVRELEAGRLRGAVLDVYSREPLTGEHPYRHLSNVVLTPHLGASTRESQHNVSRDVCEGVRDFLLAADYSRSLNVSFGTDETESLRPALELARRAAMVARALLANRGERVVEGVIIKVGDDLASAATAILSAASVGVLEGVVEAGRINLINARSVAARRGIELGMGSGGVPPHTRALEVRVRGEEHEVRVGGVAPLDAEARLTRIHDFHVDVMPRHTLLVMTNRDVPGVIGHVGTVLGDAGVNIAEYHQARLTVGGEALAVVTVDGVPGDEVRAALLEVPDVTGVTVVSFGEEG